MFLLLAVFPLRSLCKEHLFRKHVGAKSSFLDLRLVWSPAIELSSPFLLCPSLVAGALPLLSDFAVGSPDFQKENLWLI